MKSGRVAICLVLCLGAGLSFPAMASETSMSDEVPGEGPNEMSDEAPAKASGGRFTETFDEGLRAFDEGRPKRAYDLWLSIAVQGDLAAMRNLAYLLQHGFGVEVDAHEAANWYSRAAKRGLTSAQVNLAAMFQEGEGVPQNYKLAAQWYARAARAGHAHAQYKLARMIEAGHASAGNLELAKKLYGWAIDAGHSSALERLRQLDARTAPIALNVAAPRDKANLAMEGSFSSKSLAGAGDRPMPASMPDRMPDRRGNADALIRAQQKFIDGERSGAVAIWRSLAMKSDSEAQYRLALATLQGHGVHRDEHEALYWLDIAATGGHQSAAQLLATLQ